MMDICKKLGLKTISGSLEGVKYTLENYAKASGETLEVKFQFKNMADFLKRGCILMTTIKDDCFYAYLIWLDDKKTDSIDKFYGIEGQNIKFIQLLNEKMDANSSARFEHCRVLSLLQDSKPENIEDHMGRVLRREICEEISDVSPIVMEFGRNEPDKRWRGEIIGIPYSKFGNLPFLPRDAGVFAGWLSSVASVMSYGDKK